jgi:hypothetical protein
VTKYLKAGTGKPKETGIAVSLHENLVPAGMNIHATEKLLNGMKNGVFCDVTPRGSCKNPCFGGT